MSRTPVKEPLMPYQDSSATHSPCQPPTKTFLSDQLIRKLAEAGLPQQTIPLLAVLTSYDWKTRQGNRKGYVYPTNKTLARSLNRSPRTISRHLAILEAWGLVERSETRLAGGFGAEEGHIVIIWTALQAFLVDTKTFPPHDTAVIQKQKALITTTDNVLIGFTKAKGIRFSDRLAQQRVTFAIEHTNNKAEISRLETLLRAKDLGLCKEDEFKRILPTINLTIQPKHLLHRLGQVGGKW